jgi:alpha-L-fucosidase 2
MKYAGKNILSLMLVFSGLAFAQNSKDIINNVDWKDFLARNDMVWDALPNSWDDAPFIGNGTLGTIFWQDSSNESMHFEISRSDVYDHRNDNYLVLIGKARLPNGYFNLGYKGTAKTGSMRLDLWNAEVNGKINTSAGGISFKTFTQASDNVSVIEITAKDKENNFTWKWNPRKCMTTRKRDPLPKDYVAYPPQTQEIVNNINVSVQEMPEDKKYNTENKGAGQFATAWKIINSGSDKKIIYISEEFSFPGRTAKQKAIENILKAVKDGIENLTAYHLKWWHNYYQKSFLSFPDARAESFYWIQMYKMASATRKDGSLIDLMGPWYDTTNWPGIWWNLNIQLAYWPFGVSNHIETVGSLLNYLYKYKNHLAENAAKYSDDSYAIFRATGMELLTKWFPLEVGDLAFALDAVWQQYRYSMDDQMLRTKLFPLMKGAFNYLYHLSYKGNDGKIHIDHTGSPEYSNDVNDCNYTLSLFKWLARSLVYSASRLKINDSVLQKCDDVLKNITPYPTNEDGFMIGRDMPLEHSHRHWSHMFMVYPLFEYTYDDPKQAAMIDKSVSHWQSLSSLFRGYSWLASVSIASMKSDGDKALKYLNTFLESQPLRNTMYREGDPVIETPLYCARSIQDMMLMSYNNIIRVFTGVPWEWKNAEFDNFRAQGGFLVSAKRENGEVKFIRIESLAGEPCKVKTGINGVVKIYGKRKFQIDDLTDGVVKVDLKKGEYVILYSGNSLPDLTVQPVKVNDTINYWGNNSKIKYPKAEQY